MKGVIPSGTVFLVIYVASLITMALITLKFILGSPVVITIKYSPRFTASYIGLSAIADLKGWLYSKVEVGKKFNVRGYYGILDVNRIIYDLENCPFDFSLCNETCFNPCNETCYEENCRGKEDEELQNCLKNCKEACVKICNESCTQTPIGCDYSSTLLNISENSIFYYFVEGGNLKGRNWTVDFSEISPQGYLGENYIFMLIPNFTLLDPYVIEIKIYDLDHMKKKIKESIGRPYNIEKSVLANFTLTTYCPYDEDEKNCTKGRLFYELPLSILLTNGRGEYWNGFLVVRIYDWKKT